MVFLLLQMLARRLDEAYAFWAGEPAAR
jgi:hypothetical protein